MQVALVGRSNVGKSSLINSLVRQRIARTSAAPGKTRLANIYGVARGSGEPFYLVDLPGYGYARGGREAAAEFGELTKAYFAQVRLKADTTNAHVDATNAHVDVRNAHVDARNAYVDVRSVRLQPDRAALLLVDSRHPGLESDLGAWAWLREWVDAAAIVATKIDKLARGQRIRAMKELESVFEHPVLPVSAVTGEGLEELWTLIDKLTSSRKPPRKNSRSSRSPNHPGATAARPRKKAWQPPKR